MRRVTAMAAMTAICAVLGSAASARPAETGRIARVVDGDTIALAGGARVRLLQIDTPEPGGGECYSRAATRELRRLLPLGTTVTLEADPDLDRTDRYGRLLRYVRHRAVNVNVELVRRGAATVWFHGGERGRYAAQLLAAAGSARAAKRGLWSACPQAVWNPAAAAETGRSGPAAAPKVAAPAARGGNCDPSYPDVCIPPSPPDLDCADIPHRRFRVLPPDPHRFDGSDDDGLGCESG